MTPHAKLALACLSMSVLICTVATPAVAADGSIMNGTYGFSYHIDGVETWTAQEGGFSTVMQSGYGTINSQVVTVSGTLKLSVPGRQQGAFEFLVAASTKRHDENGNALGHPDYICDGPAWRWSETIDQLDSDEERALEVPFSLTIPVPGYDEDNEITSIYFVIHLFGEIYHPMFTSGWPQTDRSKFICSINGDLSIPEDMQPRAVSVLTIANGGKLDPLRIKLNLRDNSSTPAQPLKNAVIKVYAPIPGKPAAAAANGSPIRSLSGYFKSRTKCPNCNTQAASSSYTSEFYYYLKRPGEPIEVLTDDQGQAELLFYLDLPALGINVPTRDRPLEVSFRAEYLSTAEQSKGDVLAESTYTVSLNHMGYIVAVTYVQPQEWQASGGLGDYVPAGENPAEYPLSSYVADKGTGLPYDEVKGADRAKISREVVDAGGPYGNGLAGGSLELGTRQLTTPQQLKPGMLIAAGDRIDLDARGLLRYKPAAPQSPESGIKAKPGWVWVTIQFFDGLKAKVGVNGVRGQHSLTFGRTPTQSGWVPMSKAFIYWAGTKAADMALSHFVPVYGQIDTVNDVAGYLAWLSNSNPVYIRVRSDFTVICQNDGSSSLVVREGHPAVVTEQTGFAGIQAASGETAVISATNQISVAVSSAAQAQRADEILGAMLDGSSDPAGLEPVELDAPSPPASHTGGGTADYESEPDYQDEAGDVPMGWPMAYSFDEFIMGFWDDWDYTPETEHTYASLSKDDIPLYIVIVRDQVSSAVLLEVLEMDCGEPIELEVGNRDAHFYPLVENGAEFGCMLSFDDPLANGNRLHVVFLSDSNYLDEVSDLIIEIMSGMSFSR